jgi:hypothetical protein
MLADGCTTPETGRRPACLLWAHKRSFAGALCHSTSWDNEASRRVAARLHLAPIGIDFHAT